MGWGPLAAWTRLPDRHPRCPGSLRVGPLPCRLSPSALSHPLPLPLSIHWAPETLFPHSSASAPTGEATPGYWGIQRTKSPGFSPSTLQHPACAMDQTWQELVSKGAWEMQQAGYGARMDLRTNRQMTGTTAKPPQARKRNKMNKENRTRISQQI